MTAFLRFERIGLVLSLLLAACGPADPLDHARLLQEEGHLREAADHLRAELDRDPSNPTLNLAYGEVLMRAGEPSRAIWPLRKAAGSDDLGVEAGVLLTKALMQTSNPEEAVVAATQVLDRDAEHLEALVLRASANLRAKHEEQALVDAEEVLQEMPRQLDATIVRISALLTLGRLDEVGAAIEEASSGLASESDAPPAVRARLCVIEAVFRVELGEQDEGESRFEACLAEHPNDSVVLSEALGFYDARGDAERGSDLLAQALERMPGRLEIRVALAERQREAGDPERGEALLRDATMLEQADLAWLALHDYLVRLEDYAAAADAMRNALEQIENPGAGLLIAYADDLVLAGDLEAARAVARELPAPGSHLILGRIHLEEDDPVRALRELEAGIRLWPNNPVARWLAGRAAERTGDFAVAIAHYRESVRADPSKTDASYRLATLYDQAGSARDALDFATRHTDAYPDDRDGLLLLVKLGEQHGLRAIVQRGVRALASDAGSGPSVLVTQAEARAKRGGPMAGVSLLETALDRAPSAHPLVLRTLVDLYARTAEPAGALPRVEAAARGAPADFDLQVVHADALRAAGEIEPARLVYRRVLDADAQHGHALLGLARLERSLGNQREALAILDRIPPDTSVAVAAQLDAAALVSEAERERRLRALLALHPREAGASHDLAELLLLSGNVDSALILARTLHARGETREATDLLERLLAIDALKDHSSLQAELARLEVEADPIP
jgi:tetratricopeptide (TPR) repeat protein